MIQSPIAYYGSKTTIAPWLISQFPAQYSIYLEPFCGSARVLLAKDPSPVELISDLDPYLVNFWEQVRNNWHLLKFYCLNDFDRQFFRFARLNLWPPDRLEAARRFYASTKCSYKQFQQTRSFDPAKRGSFLAGLEKLEAVSQRLQRVRIERCSYEVPLLLNDTPEAFAYMDPPYHPDTLKHKHGYRIRFNAAQHQEMLALLPHLKLKVMLSGYDHPSYRGALRDWNMNRTRTHIHVGNRNKDPERFERIWMNY